MNILLDTDIGSDVDDALALALIAGSPELTLDGVVTVYGDVRLRAQIVRKYLRHAGVADSVPVVHGEQTPRSGRDVWWTGHEGSVFDDLAEQPVAGGGVDFLVRGVAASPGQIDVLAIGPLTNIAAALDSDPEFEKNVRRLVIMGGDFTEERIAEHNFLCDVDAAQRVFRSKLSIVVGSLDLTAKVALGKEDVKQIGESGKLGAVLAEEIATWWKFMDSDENNPHDPILALWLAQPELFTATRTSVDIDDEGKSWARPDVNGTVLILDTPDPRAVADQIVERIATASIRADARTAGLI